mmetsp:Transcript_50883/g.98410  ORF Transcript_50883/g.98410 Transcript_50883/m.98410 type:complete len:210 (-) Transcript_50883:605-1234(-)
MRRQVSDIAAALDSVRVAVLPHFVCPFFPHSPVSLGLLYCFLISFDGLVAAHCFDGGTAPEPCMKLTGVHVNLPLRTHSCRVHALLRDVDLFAQRYITKLPTLIQVAHFNAYLPASLGMDMIMLLGLPKENLLCLRVSIIADFLEIKNLILHVLQVCVVLVPLSSPLHSQLGNFLLELLESVCKVLVSPGSLLSLAPSVRLQIWMILVP